MHSPGRRHTEIREFSGKRIGPWNQATVDAVVEYATSVCRKLASFVALRDRKALRSAGRSPAAGTRGSAVAPGADGPARSACCHLPIVLPLAALLAITLVFHCTRADLVISSFFYSGPKPEPGWPGGHQQPWSALYEWGVYPGLMLGVGGLAVVLAGAVLPRLRQWRREGLFLGLLLLMGPGLVVNVWLKGCWGRPRPCDTVAFGGVRPFVPPGIPAPTEGRSFPSGHASMGFFLMAPAFFLYRCNKRLALWFVLLGLSAGTMIGLGRIVQGRHFASDVVWSAGMIYLTGWCLDWLFQMFAHGSGTTPARGSRSTVRSGFAGDVRTAVAASALPEPACQFSAQRPAEALRQAA